MLDETLYREGCRVAERTNGTAGDVAEHTIQQIEIFGFGCRSIDAVEQPLYIHAVPSR